MTACDPQFNLSGAYFPAWLACVLGALVGTWVLHVILLRLGISKYLRPAPIVYIAIFAALSCGLWLIFFSA